jgi:hypothetical protein
MGTARTAGRGVASSDDRQGDPGEERPADGEHRRCACPER